MTSSVHLLERLRGVHRGYKFALLLIAAWAPFLFPESAFMAGALMALATALFFLVTTKPADTQNDIPMAREKGDADS